MERWARHVQEQCRRAQKPIVRESGPVGGERCLPVAYGYRQVHEVAAICPCPQGLLIYPHPLPNPNHLPPPSPQRTSAVITPPATSLPLAVLAAVTAPHLMRQKHGLFKRWLPLRTTALRQPLSASLVQLPPAQFCPLNFFNFFYVLLIVKNTKQNKKLNKNTPPPRHTPSKKQTTPPPKKKTGVPFLQLEAGRSVDRLCGVNKQRELMPRSCDVTRMRNLDSGHRNCLR